MVNWHLIWQLRNSQRGIGKMGNYILSIIYVHSKQINQLSKWVAMNLIADK